MASRLLSKQPAQHSSRDHPFLHRCVRKEPGALLLQTSKQGWAGVRVSIFSTRAGGALARPRANRARKPLLHPVRSHARRPCPGRWTLVGRLSPGTRGPACIKYLGTYGASRDPRISLWHNVTGMSWNWCLPFFLPSSQSPGLQEASRGRGSEASCSLTVGTPCDRCHRSGVTVKRKG